MARKITLPLTEELAKTLHAGDQVLLTGTIYTSRDAGHKRKIGRHTSELQSEAGREDSRCCGNRIKLY